MPSGSSLSNRRWQPCPASPRECVPRPHTAPPSQIFSGRRTDPRLPVPGPVHPTPWGASAPQHWPMVWDALAARRSAFHARTQPRHPKSSPGVGRTRVFPLPVQSIPHHGARPLRGIGRWCGTHSPHAGVRSAPAYSPAIPNLLRAWDGPASFRSWSSPSHTMGCVRSATLADGVGRTRRFSTQFERTFAFFIQG